MASFSIFLDSPQSSRTSSSAFTFMSTTPLSTLTFDKENVDPLSGHRTSATSSKKRRYTKEPGAGPLAVKRKLKSSSSSSSTLSSVGNSKGKKGDKKRKVLGKRTNDISLPGSQLPATSPLGASDTLIFDPLDADRRAIELTVSPLADASEAYLVEVDNSTIHISDSTPMESADVQGQTEMPLIADYFSRTRSSQPTTPERSISPLSHIPLTGFTGEDLAQDDAFPDMLCLRIPLPPSPGTSSP